MRAEALWKRLDVAGHDAAVLREGGSGHLLEGTSVFQHEGRPAVINYFVDLRPDWSTEMGRVAGFVAGRAIDVTIERRADGWYLNGVFQGLAQLANLDYGFTPATNLQQIHGLQLAIGQRAALAAAWFDVDSTGLVERPQFYERRDVSRYSYEGPMFDYRAVLEIADSGFARVYPGLWEMEA